MSGTATWADRLRPLRVGAMVLLGAGILAGCGGGGGRASDPRLLTVSPDTLLAWLEAGLPVAVYDVRPDSLFEASRIPGSVPARGAGLPELSQTLPPALDSPLVFVSEDGTRIPGSPDRAAAEAGYVQVLWLEGGFRAWRAAGYPAAGSRLFPR